MDTSINNTKAFTDAIKKIASSEIQKIDAETYELREQRLAALKEEASTRYQSYIEYETSRIKNDKNHNISSLQEEAKMQLTTLRNELSEKVFSKVLSDIKKFCNSDSYKDYLLKSAKEIVNQFPEGNLEFFLNERDSKYSEQLKNEVPEIKKITISNDIKIGGIKAVDNNTKCLADNTIDLKLNNQKSWFLEQSGLKL